MMYLLPKYVEMKNEVSLTVTVTKCQLTSLVILVGRSGVQVCKYCMVFCGGKKNLRLHY